MTWERHKWHMRSGEWWIAKAMTADGPRYTVWRDRERLGTYKTAAEAKREAK